MTSLCDTDTILEAIRRQITSSSPCEDELVDLIPFYWELTASEGCYNTQLHMLLTKREAILALMGCEVQSVDSYDRHRILDGLAIQSSASTLRAQSQSTGNSARYSVGNGETKYDEKTVGRSQGAMDEHGIHTENGDGISYSRDNSKGSGSNVSGSESTIDSVMTGLNSTITHAGSRDSGDTGDCNYEYSTDNTFGRGGALLPYASFSFNGSGSDWRKFMKSSSNANSNSFRDTNWSMTRDVVDWRYGTSKHNWFNYFQSDIVHSARDYDIIRGHSRSDSRRHSQSQSQGAGDGMSEDRIDAKNAAQGTGRSEQKANASRELNRSDNQTTLILANSQRFNNLRRIYDQLTTQIMLLKKRIQHTAMPQICVLPVCCCGSCLTCLGRLYADCNNTQRVTHSSSMW